MFDTSKINAAENLIGHTLQTGWTVKEKHIPKKGASGGHFSVCYIAEKDGREGFMKVLNVYSFLSDNADFTDGLAEMLNAFNFEKELLSRCANRRFSKISELLASGVESIPGYLIRNVAYMIFEKAESDSRAVITLSENVDLAWKLRSLHNIAVGLRQLHGISISHQDLKPSNVFIFKQNVSKLGDLGRSLCHNFKGPHSETPFAGDTTYMPPEIVFKHYLSDWHERVFSTDFYLLGSIIAFYFTGRYAIDLLMDQCDQTKDWLSYTGRYGEVLPYLIEAFELSLEFVYQNDLMSNPYRDEIVGILRQLCNPDPLQRANKAPDVKGHGFDLQRIISKLDIIARKADFSIY